MPIPVLNAILLNCVESILAVIAAESVDKLVVHNSSRKGTFTYVHRLKETPFILFDVVYFTTAQKDILNSVIATHYINRVSANDSSMLFTHLAHGLLLNQVIFLVQKLIHSGAAPSPGY